MGESVDKEHWRTLSLAQRRSYTQTILVEPEPGSWGIKAGGHPGATLLGWIVTGLSSRRVALRHPLSYISRHADYYPATDETIERQARQPYEPPLIDFAN